MKTELLLGLRPGSEGQVELERMQARLEPAWPRAAALPAFIPLGTLTGLPPAGALLEAKRQPWPRLDLPADLGTARDPAGNLVFPLPSGTWLDYRQSLAGRLAGLGQDLVDALVPCGPWLLLALGPGPVEDRQCGLPGRLTINAPWLTLIRLAAQDSAGARLVTWEILAEHRVAKIR
jgi:hypothetical protein